MTNGCTRIARPLRLAALAIAPGSFCVGTPANADTRMGAEIAAGGSVESNPYLAGGASSDIAASLQISPWLQVSGGTWTVDGRGDFSVRKYTKSANGTNTTGGASLSGTKELSPYVGLSGGLRYATSTNGINFGFANVGPNDPLPPPTTPLPDISLGGTRTRTTSLAADIGLDVRLSAMDQVGASVTASRQTFGSSAGLDYDYLNAGLNYSRALSERTALTASARLGKSSYRNTDVGDGTIITPTAGVEHQLSEFISLSASIGASFARTKRGDGTTNSFTSLSGEARVCRKHGGAVCLTATRSAQPTAAGGINAVTNVSLTYDKRLSRQDSIVLSAGFASSKEDDGAGLGQLSAAKYYDAGAVWTRSWSRRLSMYVTPGFSRIENSSRAFNGYTLSAGLRFSIGAIS